MRKILFAVSLAVLLSMTACGKSEDAANIWDDEIETTAEDEETTNQETNPVEENTEKAIPIQTQNENVSQDAEADTEPEWVFAYRNLLSEKENLRNLLMEQSEGGIAGYIQGFYLHDINQDDIPELIVHKIFASTYIYTFADGCVELRSVMPYDSFSDEMIGYDVRDGKTYIYYSDAGTGTERATGINEVMLPSEQFTEDQRSWDFGRQKICSAFYGDMESEDGDCYETIEWKDAVMQDDLSRISKNEFMAIVENFNPFVFIKITDANLEKYICKDYRSLQSRKDLDNYKEEITTAFTDFMQTEHIIKDDMPSITDDSGRKAYVDLENLTVALFADSTEWKKAYFDLIERTYDDSDTISYNLVYLDDDAIPELVVDDYCILDVYSYKNGQMYTIMEQCSYGTWGRLYEYLPYKSRIYETCYEFIGEGSNVQGQRNYYNFYVLESSYNLVQDEQKNLIETNTDNGSKYEDVKGEITEEQFSECIAGYQTLTGEWKRDEIERMLKE